MLRGPRCRIITYIIIVPAYGLITAFLYLSLVLQKLPGVGSMAEDKSQGLSGLDRRDVTAGIFNSHENVEAERRQ